VPLEMSHSSHGRNRSSIFDSIGLLCMMLIWKFMCTIRKKLDGEWLVALPDTSHIDVDEDMEFIILASDGLWDSFKR
jgi:serine/threonine protein phosphatase PrpC